MSDLSTPQMLGHSPANSRLTDASFAVKVASSTILKEVLPVAFTDRNPCLRESLVTNHREGVQIWVQSADFPNDPVPSDRRQLNVDVVSVQGVTNHLAVANGYLHEHVTRREAIQARPTRELVGRRGRALFGCCDERARLDSVRR